MTLAGLLDFNPAAHGVWYVAYLMFALLGVFVLVDLFDRLRDRLRSRRDGESGEPPPEAPERRLPAASAGVLRRFWSEGRVNRSAPDRDADRDRE
ncbi:MAG: hypothetical protein AMXMBFR36_39190 [Acidobacteriota bacterium]